MLSLSFPFLVSMTAFCTFSLPPSPAVTKKVNKAGLFSSPSFKRQSSSRLPLPLLFPLTPTGTDGTDRDSPPLPFFFLTYTKLQSSFLFPPPPCRRQITLRLPQVVPRPFLPPFLSHLPPRSTLFAPSPFPFSLPASPLTQAPPPLPLSHRPRLRFLWAPLFSPAPPPQ